HSIPAVRSLACRRGRAERLRGVFLTALARTDLALCDQPILILVTIVLIAIFAAGGGSALQVELISAAANLIFESSLYVIDNNHIRRFRILRNFFRNRFRKLGRSLHRGGLR